MFLSSSYLSKYYLYVDNPANQIVASEKVAFKVINKHMLCRYIADLIYKILFALLTLLNLCNFILNHTKLKKNPQKIN